MHAIPAGTPASDRTATTCEPRVDVTFTWPPESTPIRASSLGSTRSPGSRTSRSSRGVPATEPQRELRRDAPVVHRGALGGNRATDALHPTFEVRNGAGLLAPQRAWQEPFGPLRRLGLESIDRDDRVDRVDRAAREGGVGE